MNCTLTQGEDVDPEFVNTIEQCTLELPAGRPEGCEIQITYSYDANERMQCVYKDVQTGRSKKIELESRDKADAGAKQPAAADIDEAGLDDLVI